MPLQAAGMTNRVWSAAAQHAEHGREETPTIDMHATLEE